MRANRSADTKPELALRSALHRRGLRFRKHARPLKDLRCTADVVFPRVRVAVFVDGCFWHGCACRATEPQSNSAFWKAKIAYNQARDRRNDAALAAAGWVVFRIWEHEDPEPLTERIAAAVRFAQVPKS